MSRCPPDTGPRVARGHPAGRALQNGDEMKRTFAGLARGPVLGALLVLMPGTAGADVLPKSMRGEWASDLAACPEQASEIKMTVEPKSVLFYEHGYEIRRVVRLKDGSLKASGFAVADDGRARGSITLKLLSADTLQARGEIYHRCKK